MIGRRFRAVYPDPTLRCGPPNLILISHDPAPNALRSPNSRPQTLELNNLAMIHEEIHRRAVVFYVPGEYFRIGGLEHEVLDSEFACKLGYNIAAPGFYIFRNALGFNHDDFGAGL